MSRRRVTDCDVKITPAPYTVLASDGEANGDSWNVLIGEVYAREQDDDSAQILAEGREFTQYVECDGIMMSSQIFLWYEIGTDGTSRLYWNSASDTKTIRDAGRRMIMINETTQVVTGKQNEVLAKIEVPNNLCFSIVSRSGKSLYLRAITPHVCTLWTEGMKNILNAMKNKNKKVGYISTGISQSSENYNYNYDNIKAGGANSYAQYSRSKQSPASATTTIAY